SLLSNHANIGQPREKFGVYASGLHCAQTGRRRIASGSADAYTPCGAGSIDRRETPTELRNECGRPAMSPVQDFTVALYQPDIAGNTGAILRLAACFGFEVQLIGPAGFNTSDRAFRRAGMDYLEL